MIKRRVGRFFIDDHLVEHIKFHQILAEMEFVPLRVEHLSYRCQYEFVGISKYFEEAESGSRLVTYRFEVREEDNLLKLHHVEAE